MSPVREHVIAAADLPREDFLSVRHSDPVEKDERRVAFSELTDTTETDTRAEKTPKKGVIGFLSRTADAIIDSLEKLCKPIIKKPLLRIAVGAGMFVVGAGMLVVGIPLLLSPFPGGVILVPGGTILASVGLGLVFGVGPKRAWNKAKAIGRWFDRELLRGTGYDVWIPWLWKKIFPPKKEKEKLRPAAA